MRFAKVLDKMTQEEKIRLLNGKNNWETQDNLENKIPSLFLADGPCGLRKQTGKGDHLGIEDSVPATAMVSGGCLAATWNPVCAYENGKILGEEARAEHVDVMLAPAMNLVRSPLCGRNFEYFSEDPYLTGQIAASYTEGIQNCGVGACPKHFAVNNQETEREYVNAVIDERTLREVYLPGFEETIKRAKPVAVMSALNRINGDYGAEQKHLLTDILREEWKFDGAVISDWYGVVHRAQAVKAGLDLEMPGNGGIGTRELKDALENGTLNENEVDGACGNVLHMLSRVKELKEENRCDFDKKAWQRHHETARRIAEEGIVLLKNEDAVLPLAEKERIAVIGDCAVNPRFTLEGSVRVVAVKVDNPLESMQKLAGDHIQFAAGYREGACEKESAELRKAAVSLAQTCDKVVYFMCQASGVEQEGQDREDLSLPADQVLLLQMLLKVNSNVIVVLSNASAVEMEWKDQVKGIFECFLAGQGFGEAIANLLYGCINPSGKLPVSFTKCLEDTSAYLHFPGDGNEVAYAEGVFCGYRYYDKKKTKLLFPFGFGLSYTSFAYSGCQMETDVFDAETEQFEVAVSIENTGQLAGAEVVQLYVGMFDTDVKRPAKELKRFQKVFLQPGEKRIIRFKLTKRDFSYYDAMWQEWYVPEGSYKILIGASSRDIYISEEVWVVPRKKHLSRLTGWSRIGEFRQTPTGEKYYGQMKRILKECMTEDSVFLKIDDLDCEEKLNQMPMRFLNLLTNGVLNNDQLLAWIAEVNWER